MGAVDDDLAVDPTPCHSTSPRRARDMSLSRDHRANSWSLRIMDIDIQLSYSKQVCLSTNSSLLWRGVVAALVCVALMYGWAKSYWRCGSLMLQWLLVWFGAAMRMIDAVQIQGIIYCVTKRGSIKQIFSFYQLFCVLRIL